MNPSSPTGSLVARRRRTQLAGILVALGLAVAGCATATVSPSSSPAPASVPAATPTASGQPLTAPPPASPSETAIEATPTAATTPTEPTEPTQPTAPLAGRTIVVDPGHNGKYKKSFNTKKVPAGNGKKKACNSSGTAGKGLSEHAYTWAQATLLKAELEKLGATVLLTRTNDSGLGPCVNQRAAVANQAQADLLISIHADGNYSKKARGFHVIVSTTMAGGSSLEKLSKTLATNARAALQQHTTMPRSTYIGRGTALSPRSDIATLNLLKQTPGVMLEMGNMRHSKDLALLKSTSFRKEVAHALAEAAVKTLG